MRWWRVMTLVVLVVVSGGALAMWLLGVWAPIPKRVPDPDQLRLDRIKTGLTVAAGLAAGATLLMTLRRQALSERTQRFAESDALEQRTTALYVAAAEQLGSDKAAVRLAGLYALERLGQDNPKLRQTVFDVWCAYLRMPYTPPIDVLRRDAWASPVRPAPDPESPDPAVEAERRQELEVRLTAQRLLGAHLSLGLADAEMSTYWLTGKGNRLIVDLVGAVLVDFVFSACHAGRANFSGAHFYGDVDLSEAQLHGDVSLREAHFHHNADLREAQFHRFAHLGEVQFDGYVRMDKVQFHGDTYMRVTHFHRGADLGNARFHGRAYLGEVQFHTDASLHGAEFHGHAYLDRTQFHGNADLIEAKFHSIVDLGEAQFAGHLDMTGARARSAAVLPDGWLLLAATAETDELRVVVHADDQRSESHDRNVAGRPPDSSAIE